MIGLVVNPVAGLGGPAGLKGSDGADVQAAARVRGATPRAGKRAAQLLSVIAAAHPDAVILTAAGPMGLDAVQASGLQARVVYDPAGGEDTPAERTTTGADTRDAASALVGAGASLILFVGGDGTARDVYSGIPAGVPALGVPAGVKMYSACFAVSPVTAGAIGSQWLDAGDTGLPVQQQEVLDVSEEQIRRGRVEPTLFGLLSVPFIPGRTQARKAATAASERAAVLAAARGAVRALRPGVAYLLGPGGTTAAVAAELGLTKTPLGVDVLLDGRIVLADASETQLLAICADRPAKALITVIGGQGFLLGRGNQQLSAAVLVAIGPDPLLVVATEAKLIALGGRPLLVDTGDAALDDALSGYVRIITGLATASVYPVAAAGADPAGTAGVAVAQSRPRLRA